MSDVSIERGDVFITPDGPIQVETVRRFGKGTLVSDPTVTHAQDSRAGWWRVDIDTLADDVESGDVERATLEAIE